MGTQVSAGRGEAWLAVPSRAVPRSPRSPEANRRGTAMPTKAPADSAQQQRKSAVIDDITQRLQTAEASMLTEYRGLTVTDLANLRAALRPASTDYKVYKNTLARRAAADAGFTEMAELLEGPVVIAAKALKEFAKTNPNLVVKGGMLGPRVLTVADVDSLAEVAPRDVLLARL